MVPEISTSDSHTEHVWYSLTLADRLLRRCIIACVYRIVAQLVKCIACQQYKIGTKCLFASSDIFAVACQLHR
jgi:hypothetical protein